jgi:Ni/Co efflux regulator RcnB
MKSLLIAITSLLVVLSAPQASAGELGISIVFTDKEISVIRAYYRDHSGTNSKHGKGKNSLPPGIAKNLQRGKPLPPGIGKQVLPTSLIDLLPSPPHGYERVAIDGKVLLIEIATQVIHDVLEDLILG